LHLRNTPPPFLLPLCSEAVLHADTIVNDVRHSARQYGEDSHLTLRSSVSRVEAWATLTYSIADVASPASPAPHYTVQSPPSHLSQPGTLLITSLHSRTNIHAIGAVGEACRGRNALLQMYAISVHHAIDVVSDLDLFQMFTPFLHFWAMCQDGRGWFRKRVYETARRVCTLRVRMMAISHPEHRVDGAGARVVSLVAARGVWRVRQYANSRRVIPHSRS
jgi:hypothetical protein